MSKPKLHHYVPRFLLSRFSPQPAADNPPLHKLEVGKGQYKKRRGRCSRTSVRNEAAVTHYNRLRTVETVPSDAVEGLLSRIDGEAAPLVAGLVDHWPISRPERLTMATFVYLQFQRTPRGRHWQTYMLEQSQRLATAHQLLDPNYLQAWYRERGEDVPLDELREEALELADQIYSGDLVLKADHDHAIGGIFGVVEVAAPKIANEMTWAVLHAPAGSEFIVSDHPVARHDPSAPLGVGVGWFRSPEVEVTLPIDATAALVLGPGRPELIHADADRRMVEEVNQRTYASAEWAIYGRSNAVVQSVRALVKRRPELARRFRPRPPMMHIVEHDEGSIYRPIESIAPKGEVRRRSQWPRWWDD